jgi:hypothetical protein
VTNHLDEFEIEVAMPAKCTAEIAALIKSFDFRRYGLIGDIGGGCGHIVLG